MFGSAIDRLVELSAKGSDTGARLFFPNGIELIRFTFKVGSAAEVSLTIAGEKAPKEPATEAHVSSSGETASPVTSLKLR
jgi:hypothetical protein